MSRKMRRSRDVAVSDNEEWSGFDLYGLQGDAAGALDAFRRRRRLGPDDSKELFAEKYNSLLLSHVVERQTEQKNFFLKQLEEMESSFATKRKGEDQLVSSRKLKRNELILAFNKALVLYSRGDVKKCAEICSEKLSGMINARQKPSEESSGVASRMAFLLLECILNVTAGNSSGLQKQLTDILPGVVNPSERIIEWLDLLNAEKDPQVKFLLTLYKSRIAVSEFDESGKHPDGNIRSARKDMKAAMEIFQHKLRPSFGGETESIVSSANSEENMSNAGSSMRFQEQQQQQPSGSIVLQKLNQSALSLKAHLEELKGNTKKSLILCSEAAGAVSATDAAYEAVHTNNLAVVYETNDRRHLALHALAKSLRAAATDGESLLFHPDGTARPDQTLLILHNAAICALRARNYVSAYECMATCVARSEVFRNRSNSWLRMAEACVGVFSILRIRNESKKYSTIEANGKKYGIVVDNALFSDDLGVIREELAPLIASKEDLEQVRRNPLLRALACLERVLQYDEAEVGSDTLMSTRLSLSYVCLAFGNCRRALEMAKVVLETTEPDSSTDKVARLLYNRQMATARMYAAEASCRLEEMVNAMKYLVGDGKDDAFDRLASDLSGVTFETASTNGIGKRRLAKAQTMVRSSACAVTAAMGNTQAAKQLANSANAMEDAYSANRERSSARRALIYTLMREGHQSSALTMLLSLR